MPIVRFKVIEAQYQNEVRLAIAQRVRGLCRRA